MVKTLQNYRDEIRNLLMTETNAEDHWPNTRLDRIINKARRWMQGMVLKSFSSHFDVDEELSTDANGILTLPSLFITEKRLFRGALLTPGNWAKVNLIHPTAWDNYAPIIAPLTDAPRKETWAIIGDQIKPQFVSGLGADIKYVLTYAKQVPDFSVDGAGSQSDPSSMHDRFFDGTTYKGVALCAGLAEEWKTEGKFNALAMEEAETLKSESAKRSLSQVEAVRDEMGYSRDEDPWPLADV